MYNELALLSDLVEDRVLMLVDFCKAFDSVGWSDLFGLLERMNFGPRFLGYVSLLYSDLWAHV